MTHSPEAESLKRLREVLVATTASLVAAVDLLEWSDKTRKRPGLVAGSDKMFQQMLKDYSAAIDLARSALTHQEVEGDTPKEEVVATVEEYNAVFDPADEAGRDVFEDGLFVGYMHAKYGACWPDDLEEAEAEFRADFDSVSRLEAWDAHRDTFFARLPLAALPALSAPPAPVVDGWKPTHRHVKRGTLYRLVSSAVLQTEHPVGDNEFLALYQDEHGLYWVRPADEFKDGRFALLSSEPSRPAQGRDAALIRTHRSERDKAREALDIALSALNTIQGMEPVTHEITLPVVMANHATDALNDIKALMDREAA